MHEIVKRRVGAYKAEHPDRNVWEVETQRGLCLP